MIRSILIAALALMCGCTSPSVAPPEPRDAVIYVIGRGWHTDIGLPVWEIEGPLRALEQPFPGVAFLAFGFGDRSFLLHREHTPLAMLGALLPGRAALLVTALSAPPGAAFGGPHVAELHVPRRVVERLQARLWQAFETEDGQPIRLTSGPYAGSQFYAAAAIYSGLNTCNTWTAETLNASGMAMPSAGVLFAGQVMGYAHWLSAHDTY